MIRLILGIIVGATVFGIGIATGAGYGSSAIMLFIAAGICYAGLTSKFGMMTCPGCETQIPKTYRRAEYTCRKCGTKWEA